MVLVQSTDWVHDATGLQWHSLRSHGPRGTCPKRLPGSMTRHTSTAATHTCWCCCRIISSSACATSAAPSCSWACSLSSLLVGGAALLLPPLPSSSLTMTIKPLSGGRGTWMVLPPASYSCRHTAASSVARRAAERAVAAELEVPSPSPRPAGHTNTWGQVVSTTACRPPLAQAAGKCNETPLLLTLAGQAL